MRWEGLKQQGRLTGRGRCYWWPGCRRPPLVGPSSGAAGSGRSWPGPGGHHGGPGGQVSRILRSGRRGPGTRSCCEPERGPGLEMELCGTGLRQSGTDLRQQKF